MKCFDCAHASARRAGSMARLGYWACDRYPAGHYVSAEYERECRDFVAVDADQRARRVEWWEKVK
ncbi:hypothetical protein [Laribacter hongkongensis]|uniref:hypothetical protein n=1 Tax=Laribacter hongkongensis TaxID=168471 RepID=UPI001EFC5197|nr:hypothetical protein [Laribacter hongkongensis]MCG9008027.1 hypothetical protein [Laribacter hongkongensis]MCG9017999.1 hypothetical protein [Laribacter hongkongensis]MCG9045061.1 hypothetical protein [Laribacter hongkongensis]